MSLVHRVFDKIERADQCDYHDYYHNIMCTKFSEKAKERNGEYQSYSPSKEQTSVYCNLIQLYCVTYYGTIFFYFHFECMDFFKELFINYLYILLNGYNCILN